MTGNVIGMDSGEEITLVQESPPRASLSMVGLFPAASTPATSILSRHL